MWLVAWWYICTAEPVGLYDCVPVCSFNSLQSTVRKMMMMMMMMKFWYLPLSDVSYVANLPYVA